MIPIALIGSVSLLFYSFPVPQYQTFMANAFGAEWKNFFVYLHDGTYGVLSLSMLICISYSYITEIGTRNTASVNPIIASCVSLCSFVALLGISKRNFSIANYGVMGVFFAIVVAVTSSKLFYRLSLIKILRIRPFSDGDSTTFGDAVSAIIPAAITIASFAFVNQALSIAFRITDVSVFLSNVMCSLFSNIINPYIRALLFILLIHILWFFGMHGSNILERVAQNIYVPALAVNQHLIAAGHAPTQIFTKTFFDTFVLMGGCGSTLCLLIAIFITSKNKNQLRIAKFSLFPVAFNVNELIVFGLPIVLNPIYVIPFLIIPIILTATSFAAMSLGLIPFTCHSVEWTTPIFISGYYATGSLNACFLQLFNLILGTICYMPFVKLAHTVSTAKMNRNFESLCAAFKKAEESNKRFSLSERKDTIGSLARALAEDLNNDIQKKSITLFYQPQVKYDGKVFCAEALLRWEHPAYGYIYPPLAIELAEEYRIIDQLGLLIIDQACDAIAKMNALGIRNTAISVNITAAQLENRDFARQIVQIMQRHRVSPGSLKIEITEQVALESTKKIKDELVAINHLGIDLEMDDFGMGHSSLMYLKEYHFKTVKLDGSLVREICTNDNCREIISSIVYLSKSMDYAVLAEFVENTEQRQILHDLGCNQYQGYLFSKALPFPELIEFIERKKYKGKESAHSISK